jgi:AraC family transcriptional regulator
MKRSTVESYEARFLRAVDYLQQHLDERLATEEIAHVACFPPHHFHRIFRGMAGESIQEHVRRLRLERAAQQLKSLDLPVKEVALKAGYESREAFTTDFHALFSMSPSQFRVADEPLPNSPSGVHYNNSLGYRTPDYGDAPVAITTIEPRSIAYIRHTGPYNQLTATWRTLVQWALPRGLFGPSAWFLGVAHHDPDIVAPHQVYYDAAITVSQDIHPEPPIGIMELAGGEYVTMMHKGPYELLGRSFQRLLGGWLPTSGRELRDAPAFDQYLNSPHNTRPDELVTVIHIPLA